MISFLIYLILIGFSLIINLLPEGFALWVGRQLGIVMYYLDCEHRKVALQNLSLAFGQEKSASEIRGIARRTFQNLGMTTIEFFRIPKMDAEMFKERVKIEGLEEALRLLEKKKGALLLIGHFGNWELMGFMSKVIGNPIMVIAKPMKKNKWLDQFITKIRNAGGLEVISSVKASRKVMKALSQNRVVGILIDQRAKRSEGVWADFFGRKAPTTPSLAVLAMKTSAPVLPVFMVRNGFQKHRLLIKEPLELIHTGDIKKDVDANTQLFNHTLESMIRQYPDQWFWVHRRWERKRRIYHR
ncbi:MAG: lysophospholipid acyltransferase family protein [Thermodesulfobacteriota bacterium]|jgi:KDO2-lipid IV(A) lauroyltransferase